MPAAVATAAASLRGWQERALVAMRTWSAASERPFLVAAAPGAGKTRPALELAREQLACGAARRVVVICPTGPLTRQWANAAATLGIQLQPDADDPRPPRGFHGIAVTYARVAQAGARWRRHVGAQTLVIADEVHHLGDDLAWGAGFDAAFGAARERWLLLSGTPFRSDQAAIPGVLYDDGLAHCDVAYSYSDAVRDGVCRPVVFIPYDGLLQWRSGDEIVEASFSDELSGREAGRRYRTSISVELPDGLPRILREAHERLERLRSAGHRDAGALVVAADGEHARAIAKVLREVSGRAPVVVLHTDPRAAERLERFTGSREPWIVAVNMVSEGVDIPRLRVGVYATAAKTPLMFRQIVGRFVRTIPDRAVEPSWLYLPADPVLRAHAADVESELRHLLRPRDEDDREPPDEPAARRETEPDEPPAFVPVAAEVAPQSQLSLFGAPPAATAGLAAAAPPPRVRRQPAVDAARGGDEGALPAFERRALLRDKRRRLVGELARRDRRSHADINSWLNRQAGVGRVQDATLDQLERSCELLLRALTAR